MIFPRGTCKICNCTDSNACITESGPCYWVNEEHDLCSSCYSNLSADDVTNWEKNAMCDSCYNEYDDKHEGGKYQRTDGEQIELCGTCYERYLNFQKEYGEEIKTLEIENLKENWKRINQLEKRDIGKERRSYWVYQRIEIELQLHRLGASPPVITIAL